MTTAGTAWVWFGSQKWVYDMVESVQKKRSWKCCHTPFCRELFVHITTDESLICSGKLIFQCKGISIHNPPPSHSIYITCGQLGEGKTTAKQDTKQFTNHSFPTHQRRSSERLCDRLWSLCNYIWLPACQKHMQNPTTSREPLTAQGECSPYTPTQKGFFPGREEGTEAVDFKFFQGISKVCYIDCAEVFHWSPVIQKSHPA